MAVHQRTRAPHPHARIGLEGVGSAEAHRAPSIDEELWVPMVQETDVLLVGGGDPRRRRRSIFLSNSIAAQTDLPCRGREQARRLACY
jgi:hypothetical protein